MSELKELKVLAKGEALVLDVESKQAAGSQQFYFGAGWDNPDGPVDLDIVAVALDGGVLGKQTDLVYFGNMTGSPGIVLSEDNTTGEGDGDDESIVVNTADVPSNISTIVVGLAAYSKTDFSKAPNPHFRACDGSEESSPQIAEVPAGAGSAGQTVLEAFRLNRTGSGWSLENTGVFHACGNGSAAIQGFGNLFTS